jgi:hypothetical protein
MDMPKELLDALRAQLDERGYKSTPTDAEKVLDSYCRLMATERMSLDLDIPQEVCADAIKQLVLEGRWLIDFDNKRWRLIAAPSTAAN